MAELVVGEPLPENSLIEGDCFEFVVSPQVISGLHELFAGNGEERRTLTRRTLTMLDRYELVEIGNGDLAVGWVQLFSVALTLDQYERINAILKERQ